MHYYEVATTKRAVVGQDVLTYASAEPQRVGDIVLVPLGKRSVSGVIFAKVTKPSFATKPIERTIYEAALPPVLVNLAGWISDYYATDLPTVLQLMLPRGVERTRRAPKRAEPKAHRPIQDQPLTQQQTVALKALRAATSGTVLLHGETGSGKTRLYIERLKEARVAKKGAIVLVPEIGLTGQLTGDLAAMFEDVFVIHSKQTEAQRHQQWEAIRACSSPIVVGPRSALFAPVNNLGLIVIDEAHESAYKQDKLPKYDARRVAAQLARLHETQCILGSATPRVVDHYLAEQHQRPIIRMDQTVRPTHKVTTTIVDMRDSQQKSSRSKLLSASLIEAIEQTLEGGHQSLIFHNRRGTATSVVCESCGWLAGCERCHAPLIYHGDQHQLICHVCNWRRELVVSCPECQSVEIRYRGYGTKQLVEELQRLWPSARIARFDSDNADDETLSHRYDELYRGDIDIIVGTQVIAKGLDLPHLHHVGVMLAESGLYLPDFSAAERTFQLLYQVVGRVGRHDHGRVTVQSYAPDHPAIGYGLSHDYDSFYKQELKQRQLAHFPPFIYLLLLSAERKTATGAQSAAAKLAKSLSGQAETAVLGPAPAYRERTQSGYRWQVLVRSHKRERLSEVIAKLPANWLYDLDPENLL